MNAGLKLFICEFIKLVISYQIFTYSLVYLKKHLHITQKIVKKTYQLVLQQVCQHTVFIIQQKRIISYLSLNECSVKLAVEFIAAH